MKNLKNQISQNLVSLRKLHGYTQERIAEHCGVSRQSVAKWESGESEPDISYCVKLTELYDISLDNLINYSSEKEQLPIPPKGKHLFGIVTINERGQIVIPKKAREVFNIQPGDSLCVLGDENQGLAIIPNKAMQCFFDKFMESTQNRDKKDEQE